MRVDQALVLWCGLSFSMVLANTAGFHRLLTHRSYRTTPIVRWSLTLLSALHSGSPMLWVGVHRMHHAHADTRLDPHAATEGFWHAHCGWLIGSRYPLPCAVFAMSGIGLQLVYLRCDVRRLAGRLQPTWRSYCRDLANERLMRFLDTPLVVPTLFVLQVAAAWAIGRWAGLAWLWALHVVQNNLSWAINSVCHEVGPAPCVSGRHDRSRNVAWLAWFTHGESFHANHHRHPNSAWHALNDGPDLSWIFICVLHRMGGATDVRLPTNVSLPRWARRHA